MDGLPKRKIIEIYKKNPLAPQIHTAKIVCLLNFCTL